jgi:hypothetical protein
MHSAEDRALRELRVFGTRLASHWEQLGRRLDGAEAERLAVGAADAHAMLTEIGAAAAARDVPTHPAAALTGRLTSARPMAPDHLLERNQALRYALLDVQHCATLLAYAAARGDEELRALLSGWQEGHERAVRAAAIALAARPDDATAPAIPTVPGRLEPNMASHIFVLDRPIQTQPAGANGDGSPGHHPPEAT